MYIFLNIRFHRNHTTYISAPSICLIKPISMSILNIQCTLYILNWHIFPNLLEACNQYHQRMSLTVDNICDTFLHLTFHYNLAIGKHKVHTPPLKEPIDKKFAICPELGTVRRHIGEYIFWFSACPVGLFGRNLIFCVFSLIFTGAYWDKRFYGLDVALEGPKWP